MPTYPLDESRKNGENVFLFLRAKSRTKDGKTHRYWSIKERSGARFWTGLYALNPLFKAGFNSKSLRPVFRVFRGFNVFVNRNSCVATLPHPKAFGGFSIANSCRDTVPRVPTLRCLTTIKLSLAGLVIATGIIGAGCIHEVVGKGVEKADMRPVRGVKRQGVITACPYGSVCPLP